VVVFFGENVPKETVQQSFDIVNQVRFDEVIPINIL
jgi:hypothetical protein